VDLQLGTLNRCFTLADVTTVSPRLEEVKGHADPKTAGRMALAKAASISFSDLNKIMSKERRAPQGNPANGSAAGFDERGLEYRHERLKRDWTACPACGGVSLRRPDAVERRRVPEAEGVCGTCGAALMRTASGKSKVITSRRAPDRRHP
jgi:hypothetical protein